MTSCRNSCMVFPLPFLNNSVLKPLGGAKWSRSLCKVGEPQGLRIGCWSTRMRRAFPKRGILVWGVRTCSRWGGCLHWWVSEHGRDKEAISVERQLRERCEEEEWGEEGIWMRGQFWSPGMMRRAFMQVGSLVQDFRMQGVRGISMKEGSLVQGLRAWGGWREHPHREWLRAGGQNPNRERRAFVYEEVPRTDYGCSSRVRNPST